MPPESPSLDTPMMQQYARIKEEVGEAILLFRLGDFYEMFHDDAVVASRALDITLTARGREGGHGGYPMCGVPYHAADGYVARLVRQGFKVAVCDQVEDPRSAKGVVRREVVRIVTPGTVTDERSLVPAESSFLTALLWEQGRIGLAHVDATTGEFRTSEHDPESEIEHVRAELSCISPREILVPAGTDPKALDRLFRGTMPPLTEADPWTFSRQRAREVLAEHYRVAGLGAWGLEGRPAATRAAGAALAYLRNALRSEVSHLEAPRAVTGGAVVVDPTTRRNLELVENLQDGSREGTLLSVLDFTSTPTGSRTLRTWLLAPLADVPAVRERLDAVGELHELQASGRPLASDLAGTGDLERLAARAVMGSATPRDVRALGEGLGRLPALRQRLERASAPLLGRLGAEIHPLAELRSRLDAAIVEGAPPLARDGGFVKEGYSAELDDLRVVARDGRAHLARLEARERERTGISSLKVRHNKVFGYYIEISKANLDKVPPDYQRRQTVATGERFSTAELKDLEGRILTAHDRSIALELEILAALCGEVAGQAAALRETARAVGAADALAAFAAAATAHGYVRPEVDDGPLLEIRAGRHPVVELREAALRGPGLGDGRFVPNDTDLGGDVQVAILTGPNMGGKSTYLRQVALLTLMAQAGSFVPAASARIGIVDKIFTRVGASDSLASGQSTFMVEMTETARILHEATRRSLVILDEIGRGTATFDGLSIAWAVAEYLHETPRAAARTLFATHYHELTELALLYPRVGNLRMATREWRDDIVFLHRVERGTGDRSYGIQVARLAGLPPSVIARARQVLANLERNDLDPTGRPRLAAGATSPAPHAPQLPLFGAEPENPRLRELAERLRDVDVDGMTPRQALEAVAELRSAARDALS